MAVSIPALGTVDWKWFFVGLIFAMFVMPAIMRLISTKRHTRPVV